MGQTAVRDVMLGRRPAAESLLRGHPWVWAEAIAKNQGMGLGEGQAAPGEEVQVLAPDGTPVGRGLADPGSPIAVRLWTRDRSPLDAALFRDRVERACDLRVELVARPGTTAYRVLHGEGDRTPGFVVDRYGPVAVLRTDGDAASARVKDV